MKINRLHEFDLTFGEAAEIQRRLAGKVVVSGGPRREDVELVAGCDCAFDRKSGMAFGAIVLFKFPEMKRLRVIAGHRETRFPYVPGYLSFRELEVLLDLFARLENPPDLVLVDGQGIAHPRRIGLASHLGLFLNVPTIGCAKSRLVGEADEPGEKKGEWKPIMFEGEVVGSLLRTRDKVKPMFISPGHRMEVDSARDLALACVNKYRMPEPTRIADIEVAKYKRRVLDV